MGYRIEDAIRNAGPCVPTFALLSLEEENILLSELTALRAAAEKGERYIKAMDDLQQLLLGNNPDVTFTVRKDGHVDIHSDGTGFLMLISAIEAAKGE